MTLGEKIYRLRTEQGMSQEIFGETLGVSRQSVSKWETDQSVPELDKIVAISEMFAVSTDYLLKDDAARQYAQPGVTDGNLTDGERSAGENTYGAYGRGSRVVVQRSSFHYEYKSNKTFLGLPLVHINIGFRPVRAKGVIAIGNAAQGIIAIGIAGIGVITLAPAGIGLLLAIGVCALGGVAFGSIAVGVIAGGAVSVGVFSMGALAVGQFSFGALAVGQQIAIGDSAHGNIALGFSEAVGAIYEEVQAADGSFDHQAMLDAIDANVPGYFRIFTGWMKGIVRMMARP